MKYTYKTVLTITLCLLFFANNAQLITGHHYAVPNTAGDGVPDLQIIDIGVTIDNTLLVSTYMGGLGLYKDGQWSKLTTEDGLPIDFIYKALEDNEGKIWIITEFGLSVWDQTGMTHKSEIENPNDIIKSRSGHIWVGTGNDGIYKYNAPGEWDQYTTEHGLADDGVICLFEDKDDGIWVGTYEGVSYYDGSGFTTHNMDSGLSSNKIYHIGQDETGNVWCASFNQGADVWNGADWSFMPVYYVRDFYLDEQDTLWIAGNRTIYQYKDNVLTEYLHYYDLPIGLFSFTSFKKDLNDNKYIGTYHDGILKKTPSNDWALMELDLGLITNDVEYIFSDISQNLWFGGRRGLSQYNESTWTSFKYKDPFSTENIQNIYQSEDKHIWVTTGEDIYEFEDLNYTTHSDLTDQIGEWVNCTLKATNGTLWFGTFNGIHSYDGNHWMQYTIDDGLHTNSIEQIVEDGFGGIWFVGDYGITGYDGQFFTAYTPGENGFSDGFIYKCYKSSIGEVWVGTRNGLSHYNGSEWITYDYSNSNIKSRRIHDITEDNQGNIWLACYYNIQKYEGGTSFKEFDEEDGIPYDIDLISVHFDQEGSLWVGTYNFGVFQLDVSTSLAENIQVNELNIFPNPAKDQIHIDLEELTAVDEFQILDMSGNLLRSNHVRNQQPLTISINDLNTGLYFLFLKTNNKVYSRKFYVFNE